MSPALLVAVAIAPGLFWLWFFARRHVYRPGPRRLLALTFVLGMVSTIPALVVESVFLDETIVSGGATFASVAAAMLLVVGPVEEAAKFAVVRLGPYRSLYFDEPMDGLVYGAAASLGFASLENVGYVLSFGPEVMLVRAPLTTVAHVVFGSIWGYALGLRTQPGGGGVRVTLVALILASVAHAIFNLAAFAMPFFALALAVLGVVWVLGRFNWAQRVSPFRYRRNYPQTDCASCNQRIRVTSRYCRFCGERVQQRQQALLCGNCGARARPDASFCTTCGDRFLK